jgi:hypothetical protein
MAAVALILHLLNNPVPCDQESHSVRGLFLHGRDEGGMWRAEPGPCATGWQCRPARRGQLRMLTALGGYPLLAVGLLALAATVVDPSQLLGLPPGAAAAVVGALGLALLLAQALSAGSAAASGTAQGGPQPPAPLYAIHPKHQKSVKNNILSGITLSCWLSLLWRRAGIIEWLRYWPRLCFLSIMSCLNSAVGCVEWALYSRAWRRQPLPKAPVFILGHPRTGTTLLHNLLSRDQETFIFCSMQPRTARTARTARSRSDYACVRRAPAIIR